MSETKTYQQAARATAAFYKSQDRTGTDSEETEEWRDTCDHLYHQLTPEEQKRIRKLERRFRKKYQKANG